MARDFSKKTLSALSKKGIAVVGAQAIPAFEGDQYFTGTGYKLVRDGCLYVRTFQQVLAIAQGADL